MLSETILDAQSKTKTANLGVFVQAAADDSDAHGGDFKAIEAAQGAGTALDAADSMVVKLIHALKASYADKIAYSVHKKTFGNN